MYYIKYIVKFDCIRLPGVVITTLINSFDDWFMKVFVVKMIIDALLNSFDLNYILWMIIIAIGFKSLKTIYDSCWSYYTKRSDQKIVSGFQHVAFLKAADVDLQCYDDSDFYNEALVDSAFVFATASRLGLDVEEYKQELLSAVNYDRVNHTINKLMERGLFATPTIIINDRLIYITNSYEELTRLLKQELEL